jgi:hypothetical protein
LRRAGLSVCWRMDWQQFVALLIVGLSAGLLVWGRWRRRSGRQVCGSTCGCAAAHQPGPNVSVIYRARKGARPQIITRWPAS